MKNKIMLLSIILSVVGVLTGCGITYGGIELGEEITLTETLTDDDVENIKIDVSSANVNVIKEEREDIYVEFKTYENGHKLRTKEGAKTVIETYTEKKISFNGFNTDYRLTVYVPEEYKNDMDFDLSSGNITLNEFTLDNVDIEMSSGNINFENIAANNMQVSLSSGNVDFDNVLTESLSVSMSSGNVALLEFTGAIKGTSSSGSFLVRYKDQMDNLDFEATSGSIEVDYNNVPVDAIFDLRKTSGDFDVNIDLDDYHSADDGDEISGVSGEGTYEVMLEITSGDIEINK